MEESGCIQVAEGRHKHGIIGRSDDGTISDDIVENIEKYEKLVYQPIPTDPGDIIIFDGYLPHRSGINKTNSPRRILYATYNTLDEGDLRTKYYENKRSNQQDILKQSLSSTKHFDGNIVTTIGNN